MATIIVPVDANVKITALVRNSDGKYFYRNPISPRTTTSPFGEPCSVVEMKWSTDINLELNTTEEILDANSVSYLGGRPTGR